MMTEIGVQENLAPGLRDAQVRNSRAACPLIGIAANRQVQIVRHMM
jgi:hypothetical protein